MPASTVQHGPTLAFWADVRPEKAAAPTRRVVNSMAIRLALGYQCLSGRVLAGGLAATETRGGIGAECGRFVQWQRRRLTVGMGCWCGGLGR